MIQESINKAIGDISKATSVGIGVSNLAKQARADELKTQAKAEEQRKKEEATAAKTQYDLRRKDLANLADEAYGVSGELRKAVGPGSRGKKSRAASYEAQARNLENAIQAMEREAISEGLRQGFRSQDEVSGYKQASMEKFYRRMEAQIEKLRGDLGNDRASIEKAKARKLEKTAKQYGGKK